jgi:hypothetical protein
MKPFLPKRVETKAPRGPGTKGVLPRYVSLGNAKKVAKRWDLMPALMPGRVFADFSEDGELIGVEVIG